MHVHIDIHRRTRIYVSNNKKIMISKVWNFRCILIGAVKSVSHSFYSSKAFAFSLKNFVITECMCVCI